MLPFAKAGFKKHQVLANNSKWSKKGFEAVVQETAVMPIDLTVPFFFDMIHSKRNYSAVSYLNCQMACREDIGDPKGVQPRKIRGFFTACLCQERSGMGVFVSDDKKGQWNESWRRRNSTDLCQHFPAGGENKIILEIQVFIDADWEYYFNEEDI